MGDSPSATLLWNMTGLYRKWTASCGGVGTLRPQIRATRRRAKGTEALTLGTKERARRAPGPRNDYLGVGDHVMQREICLDGLAEDGYLAPGSEVITLPGAGHWVPLESECLGVLAGVLRGLMGGAVAMLTREMGEMGGLG
ncbi:uncharacterized protein DSM5745_10158 [Aspergillus mulundensis]|uniref:Uncharacterized protein n=1 Tax=Aspergillus mulundensis TaxID=1810919 RepID=A0A3D8QMP2_9EURO|nr:hypothetical protein DSM5745_10158 [Aspergillus mulundensis]RDW63047.1 hypothetical protein DSM5745_10158 [Aspergillus mulundensis]